MDNTLCCFPVEVKTRDFDARLYQALICLKQNRHFSCFIGHKAKVNKRMFDFGMPFLYFSKGMNNSSGNIELCRRIHNNNGKIILLDEEGGASVQDHDWFLLRYIPEILWYVNLNCVWGENQKKILQKYRNDITNENTVITGHPRFDLKKLEFESFYIGLRKNKFDWNKKYILFNLNFGFSNTHIPKEQLLQQRFQDYEKRFPGQFEMRTLEKKYDYKLHLCKLFIEAIQKVALQFKDRMIVVRPHPSENIEMYENEFKDIDNVFFTQEGNAQEWIIDAEMVIHHDCTTAIETFIYGKIPIISYSPLEYDQESETSFVNQLPKEISIKVTNIEDLLSLIRKNDRENEGSVTDKKEREKKTESLKKVIANVDFNSAELIAKEAERIADEPDISIPDNLDSSEDTKEAPYPLLHIKLMSAFGIFSDKLNKIYRKNKAKEVANNNLEKQNEARSKTKFSGLSYGEVEQRVNLLRAIDADIPAVRIKVYGEDLFVIERKQDI